MAGAAPPLASNAWTCGECGYANPAGPLCVRCGVARRWQEDPPLDVPPAPGAFERPAAWFALLHGALALLGALLLWRPELAPFLALTPAMQAVQVALSLAAAWASLDRAAVDRLFWRVELASPDRAPAGDEIRVTARLVPYARRGNVHVEIALLENTYVRDRDPRRHGVTTRTKVVARHRMLRGGQLPGRRASEFEAIFAAPFPTGEHRDVRAEIQASFLGAFAWLVPGLGEVARNLREHGGVWVRLKVRAGPWRRRIERRVFVYHMAGDRLEVA